VKMTDADLERLVLIGESHVATLPAVVRVQVGAEVLELARECLAARKRAALDALAHGMAYDSCKLVMGGYCVTGRDGGDPWLITETQDFEGESAEVKEAVGYLEARGLLERHQRRHGWVRVRDESEATA
jgi:hypothetical protein